MRTLFLALCALGLGAGGAHADPATIMTGKPAGTYIQFGHDIAGLAKRFDLDLVAQPSAGSLENVEAVLKRPNTQLGIVQSDVLDFVASFSDDPDLRYTASKLRMVFPLYNEEVHILARPGVGTLADLHGRRVAVGAPNSGTLLTATLLLATANVVPGEELRIDTDEALRALRQGQVDAMFYIAGQPARIFAEDVRAEDKLHLVPVTDPAVAGLYPSATIQAGAYPWLREDVPTVAVRAVLMAYDYSKPNWYHRQACAAVGKVARIIHDNIDRLRRPGYGHPKWQQVDLDADLVSWERSKCAEDGLNGPQGYVLAAEAAEEDCDAEDNAIRRKLCLVKKQMRQQAEQPVASAGAM